VLGVPFSAEEQPTLHLDGAEVRFLPAEDDGAQGLVEIAVQLPPELHRGRTAIPLGGVRIRLIDSD
jgi:hypothetical protein